MEIQGQSETRWLTVRQVMNFEGITRQEVYRRMKPGDPHFLVSRGAEGKPGRLINPLSMTHDAQVRWRKWTLSNAAQPRADAGQLRFFPDDEVDKQIAALTLPQSERDLAVRRFRAIQPLLDHTSKALEYGSKGEHIKLVADQNLTSPRSIRRWLLAYKLRGKIQDLANDLPGPAPGTGTILDDDMRAYLEDCWRLKKLPLSECYRSLMVHLKTKQNKPGCRVDHVYHIPSRATVERFICSLGPLDDAARQGPDAFKAAAGHIDRTYRDARSLDRVATDEWISDVLAYDPRHVSKVGRYYVLTFLDERSLCPLVWSLVPQPNEQDEIDLLCRLIREFGVPGLINSDRGRFRGRTFGGRFLSQDRAEMYPERDGILDRIEIRRNSPREHNPRGNRLERFHLELARWARTVPGWCGSDTKQRRMTDADARVVRHKEWIRTGQGESPLLSRDQLLERLNQFMVEFRQRPSDGTDMDGFAPEAVFRQNTPTSGLRRISDEELAWHTAERFEVMIGVGGIIQLRDGKRYSDPQLLLLQGQHREIARLRHDHERVSVLPAAKGQDVIIAARRARVGVNDPDELARQMELQTRLRKIVGEMVKPLDYDPGQTSGREEPPKAAQVIHPSEFMAAQEEKPEAEPYISSTEYMMTDRRLEKRAKALGFADLED